MAALRVIRWSPAAVDGLERVYQYLSTEWSQAEVVKLSNRVEAVVSLLSASPQIFKTSSRVSGTRECAVTGHNTLFYTFDDEYVYIIAFLDNRQKPN